MRTWALRLGVPIVALLAVAGLLWSAAHQPPRTLAEQTREVARSVRCPTCVGEDAADSTSPVAGAMRDVISDQLADGRSPAQVRSWFAERYGDEILLDPPRRGYGWLLWAAPVALVVAAVVLTGRGRRGPPWWWPLVAGAGVVAVAVVVASWEALGLDRPVPVAVDRPAVSAAEVLGAAAAEHPGDAQLQIAVARALEANGRPAEAAEHYAAASRLRPFDADLASRHATALVRAGAGDEAVQVLRDTLAAQPNHVPSLLLLGTLLRRTGDDAGIALLQRFLDLAPEHPAAAGVRRLLAARPSAATLPEKVRTPPPSHASGEERR